MASFIDLLGNVIWSEADITARTESMVHQIVPASEELILTRKVLAAQLGQWNLTADEQALLARYTAACLNAKAEGIAARADMALLLEAMAVERAQARLALPTVAERDQAERDAAQTALDGAVARLALPEVGADQPAEAIAQDAQERAAAQEVFDTATARLALPLAAASVIVDGIETSNEAVAMDNAERAVAQSVLDGATTEVMALVALRNPPPPEPPPEPAPEQPADGGNAP